MADVDLSVVGSHFFLGLQPTTVLSDLDKRLLATLKPAGVILFKSNFVHDAEYEEWLAVHDRLIGDIRECVEREKLLIAIDHEGARVCRTPPPITRFKSASEWNGNAYDVGKAMGEELSSLGLNMSFAPVMDIHTNPDNPVIAERAFGTSSDVVSQSGTEFMRGLQEANVWSCAKHFPGHGHTSVDSHKGLPVVEKSEAEISDVELLPFGAAVKNDVPMIMTAHILFPKIDAETPATLSKTITTGILRDKLGYNGVVVSDDIGMRAMDGYFQDPAIIRKFLEAGNDMLMICAHMTDTERVIGFAEALSRDYEDIEFRESIADPSQSRIQSLLGETTMHSVRKLHKQVFLDHQAICGTYGDETVEVV